MRSPTFTTSDENSELRIGGLPISQLASDFGTPIYVYNAERVRQNYQRLTQAIAEHFRDFQVFYAIKACNNISVAQILTGAGAGIDAASPNELRLAQLLKVDAGKTLFTGNNLSDSDLQFGLESGAIINLDDDSYLPRLLRYGRPSVLSYRINPGHIHGGPSASELDFSGPQATFGIHRDAVFEAYHEAKAAGIIQFGVHMMPYSNVLQVETFSSAVRALLEIILPVVTKLDISLDFIDIGGGLGIPYNDSSTPLDLPRVIAEIKKVFTLECKAFRVPIPRLFIEPARYLVGDAGYLIGRVNAKKYGYQTIIGTDIGMNTFVRTVLYRDSHRISVNGRHSKVTDKVSLSGQICENTDLWSKTRHLPVDISIGDLIVVHDTGAYGYGMAYQYNGRLRPAEILIDHGEARLIRRAETFDDMTRHMVPEPGLGNTP